MLLLAALGTTLSFGQGANDFTVFGQTLLAPGNLVWGLRGTVGSPSVTLHEPYDVAADVLLMAYETQVGPADALCPDGRWGVGLAFRTFGTNVRAFQDAGAIIRPTAGSYYSCVAAHPTIVELTDNPDPLQQSWLVYFKSERECDPMDAGCERYSGLGQLIIQYNEFDNGSLNYLLLGPDPVPALTAVAQDMGYPKAAFADGEYHIAFGQFPDVYLASSPFVDSFPTPSSPVLTAGTPAIWGEDELLSPALLCDGTNNLKMYPVGRSWDVMPSMLTDASVGLFEASSTDGFATWTETNGAPFVSTASGDPQARHVHMSSSSGVSEYGMYFSTPNGSGNVIRFAGTAGFNWRNTDSRRCP